MVALESIRVTADPSAASNGSTGWPGESITLQEPGDAALYMIDSSTPYLWLPESVCLQFEKALGLTYDPNVELYTFGNRSSQHDVVVGWNLTFTFVVADEVGSSRTVSLAMPYGAFDLQLSYPFPGLDADEFSPATDYFPLRKAANDTQYTLGRAFLQESLLLVDNDRGNFSLFPAVFPSGMDILLVDIIPPIGGETFRDAGPVPVPPTASGKGSTIGIAVGVAVGVTVLIGAALWWWWWSRRRSRKPRGGEEKGPGRGKKPSFARFSRWLRGASRSDPPTEMDGATRAPTEAPDTEVKQVLELPGTEPVELPGVEVEVPPYVEATRKGAKVIIPSGHDPQAPAELEHQPARGYYGPDGRLRPSSTPYSPHHVGRQNTQTTGVSSRSMGTSRDSSRVSSPTVISPVTPNFSVPMTPFLADVAIGDGWRRGNESDQNSLTDHEAGSGANRLPTPRSPGSDRPGGSRGSPRRSPHRFSYEEPG